MVIQNIALLLAAAFPLMGSPGPATLSLAATGSVFGFSRGLPYFAGIVIGTTAVLLIIASGITGLLLALPNVLPVLTILALCYIVFLACKIATAPVLVDEAKNTANPSMIGGLLLAIANPKAFAAIGAVYAGVSVFPEEPALDAFAKIVTLTAVIVAVNAAWLALGAVFATVLRNPHTGRAINLLFAVLLIASVVGAITG